MSGHAPYIHFWIGAWDSIQATDYARPEEIGWTLLGRDEGHRIVIEQAHFSAVGDERSAEIDLGSYYRLEHISAPPNFKGRTFPRELRVIGSAHTHPYIGRPQRSEIDMNSWRETAKIRELRWAGVILQPQRGLWSSGFPTDEPDWDEVAVGGWITSPDGTIRPAQVIVEDPEIGALRAERRYWNETLKREETT